MQSASSLIKGLKLTPHPEGGHYREIFRSESHVERALRGDSDSQIQVRSSLTSIYYLLEMHEKSRWHVVASDEVWHFYEGDALELLTFRPGDDEVEITTLGRLVDSRQTVSIVPAGVWQAARSLGAFSLVGCTVGPGFEFEDFQFVADLADFELDGVSHDSHPIAPHTDLL